jgi:hypothetical protein
VLPATRIAPLTGRATCMAGSTALAECTLSSWTIARWGANGDMPAECSICGGSISSQARFVLSGTEVMHSACARSGRDTALQRLRQKVATLEIVASSAERLERENAHLRREMSSIEHAHRERVSRLERTHSAELSRVTAERDAARTEAALHQALGARPGLTAPVEPTDTRDASEVRFSLLELDSA